MIFSFPLTMKYPPNSSDSSFLCTSKAGELFARWHLFDFLCQLPCLRHSNKEYRCIYLNHDGHVAQFSDELMWISIIDPVLESSREFAAIC